MIEVKNDSELQKMREAGKVTAAVLKLMTELVKPGISTLELDAAAEKTIRSFGATPLFLGYYGFPGTICASVNEEVVHGIPKKDRILKSGDIISIDTGARLDGFCSDAAITLGVGEVSDEAQRLMDVTKKSLYKAIGQVKPGKRLGDVEHAVETFAKQNGVGVVRDYCGHGIGRNMHEEPSIPNFGKPGTGPLLEKGMVLAIEPMLTAGTYRVRELDDGWTVVTADGKYAAHFEHTVAVTANGSEIFTAFE
ncbi:type I methionyl aminopeptidase [Candidatus Avelusimicrobium fimicolum]|jgi:methionyl aminopeptidase|uniref:type I methionyl aminopeptidase n=1 Tax=Candidatus Avelusimicrobium TaxID=2840538 RepID=UPI0015B03ACE|nr:type I methionyl aminopeptidase [Spirochaetia bacterium]MDY3911150.1 type I methionyl aminopeptidase [Elusimicrobiaceae bacterium]